MKLKKSTLFYFLFIFNVQGASKFPDLEGSNKINFTEKSNNNLHFYKCVTR